MSVKSGLVAAHGPPEPAEQPPQQIESTELSELMDHPPPRRVAPADGPGSRSSGYSGAGSGKSRAAHPASRWVITESITLMRA